MCARVSEAMETESRGKAITVAQVVIAILVAIGIAWIAVKLVGYNQAQQVYRDIESAYANEGSKVLASENPIDFAALQKQYPSVVAWLQMDDVDISYPVVQGEDNSYYLSHDPAGNDNLAGSIFLDWRDKSLEGDLHSLIYGHNMRDESMFGQLDNYMSEDFYKKGTGTFRLYTPTAVYRYQIFAVNVVDPTDDTYQVGFTNTQAFDAFARQLKERSAYETGVDVAGYDHIVTLSTCSDTNRLVLSAKRL